MNIIYISSACENNEIEKVNRTAKIKLAYSIINFHNSIIEGININSEKIDSLIGLPVSIKTNKRIFWKGFRKTKNGINYIYSAFINIPILKQITMAYNMRKNLKKWIKKHNENEDNCIIIDSSFVSILPSIYKIAKRYNIPILGIFADIYDYMFDVENTSNKNIFVKKFYRRILKDIYSNFNGYVFLTQDMNELVNNNNKPYIVIEGLVNSNKRKIKNVIENKYEEKVCIYAGGLNERYGLKNLVEAFLKIKENNVKLFLYGTGDLDQYLKKINDNRIIYFGQTDNQIVLENEVKATLLINPRFTNEEYTKYSFPSKIMEYMLSGTPVLTTKLLGIPKEYDEYLYYIEDESINGMKDAIEEILKKDKKELHEIGMKAQKYVIENKNNIIQAKKILKLLEKISGGENEDKESV